MSTRAILVAVLLLAGPWVPSASGQGAESSEISPRTSPWYLDRDPGPREPRPQDDVPAVAAELAALMRDGGMPGFYDGQFAGVADQFDELARLAADPHVHATLRQMAVMALQEAAQDGTRLGDVLGPLVMPAEEEFQIEWDTYRSRFSPTPPSDDAIREQMSATLSRHARFALAKAGRRLGRPEMTQAIRDKIELMQEHVRRMRPRIAQSEGILARRPSEDVEFAKVTWFNIGYHYQQFDDYEMAAQWFRSLCEELPESRDARWARYNLACMAAIREQPEEAVAELRKAYDAGFTDVSWMTEDGDLLPLHGREDFQALVRLMTSGEAAAAGGSGDPPETEGGEEP